MSVEFEGDYNPNQINRNFNNPFGQTQTKGITGWLIKKGIIKDESGAKAILLTILFINIILTAIVLYIFVL